MEKKSLAELLEGTDVKVSEMCNCECHTNASVMHVAPCCKFAHQKAWDRHPQQETIDFVGSLINRDT